MLKLIGAVMIFGSCAALGLSARQNLRRRVTAADAMLLALSLIGSEISCRRTPLPEIIGELAENQNPTIRLVFSGLRRRLREQNGLSLSYLCGTTAPRPGWVRWNAIFCAKPPTISDGMMLPSRSPGLSRSAGG